MTTQDDETIDLGLTLHAASALAILVSDGEKRVSVWLPRSRIEYDKNASEGDVVTVTMPVWLATAKGLI
jgi:hypothetical protein